MEITVGNAEEDNKFAFLLGSALRNEETEQALAIYDNLIPKNISESRLEKIKESARIISELPEHEFNRLVINARYFSLAPGRSSMSQGGWSSVTPTIKQNISDHENDLEQHPSLFSSSHGKYNKDYQDEDSGLASCKLSESLSTEDEQSFLFENVNCNSKTDLVRITSTYNPPYDEEVKADSSTGGSSVESPRSETSVTQDEYSLFYEGTEMETFTFKETPTKQSSYFNHENDCWDYMPRANTGEKNSTINSPDIKKTSVHVDKSLNLDLKLKDESKFQHKSVYQSEEDRRKWNLKELSDGHDYLDVNGNPKTKDITNYSYLRKSPESTIISHLNHTESVSSRKRRSHKKQEKTILAENCEGYKGDLPLHELIDYITGHGKAVDSSGCGDVLCKSDKAKKKLEKNKKEKNLFSKDRKKGEISDAVHFHENCETLVSLTSSETLTIPLETSEKEKLFTNIGPNSMQKLPVENSLKNDNRKTDTPQKLTNYTNSAKFEGIPVLKCVPLGEVLNRGDECKDTISKADGDRIGSPDVSSLNCDSLDLSSDIKTEDSFTEVKKKKKKVISNAAAGYLPSANSAKAFFTSSGSYNPRARHNFSHNTPYSSSLIVTNHSHSPRDLSPSSFPALSGTPPRLEVRRNSCDGINTVSVDTKNDSDRESVKSLPITHGTRAIGELSPVHMISYANMVAAPPKSDNVNSSESSVVSSSLSSAHNSCGPQVYSTVCGTPEKKPTVWKGSPRERRHSIGSSPEDKNEADKPNITQRNRQKSGSQELLCRDMESNVTFKDSVVISLQSHLKQENNASKINTNATSDIHLDNEFLADNSSSPTDKISSQSFSSVFLENPFFSTHPPENSDSSENGSNSESATINKDLDPARDKKDRSHTESALLSKESDTSKDKNSTLMTISARHFKNTLQTSSLTINCNKTNCPVLEVTKKSNTNNHKSVVFLDKRDSEFSSKNLGITFGFDSGFESTNSTSQAISQSSQFPDELTQQSYHSNSNIASTPVNFHIPPDGGASLASDLHVSSFNNNLPQFKTQQLQNHCNGLIFPSNNLKDDLMDKTACDIKNNLCLGNKETSNRQSLTLQSSQLPDTSLSSLQTASQDMSTANNNSSFAGLVYSPSYPPPSYSHGASTLAADTPCSYQVNPVTNEQSLKSWEVDLPSDIVKSFIPVVYGLKIQPSKGCGKLMFIPPSIKLGANSSAVSSFLKKQWSEVNKRKNNVGSFKTCQDDD